MIFIIIAVAILAVLLWLFTIIVFTKILTPLEDDEPPMVGIVFTFFVVLILSLLMS